MKITVERAKDILRGAAAKRILVVGDLMMDRFVYGSVSRISPEAPVPVVKVTHEKAMACGASFLEAAELSNFAAGVVVGTLGTATCTQQELIDYMTTHAEAL